MIDVYKRGAAVEDPALDIGTKLSQLPPFHPAALKLLNISLEDESAVSNFEEAFKSDPALAADLLQMANSAAFGRRSHIPTISHALRFLGLERVRSLATTIALRSRVQQGPGSEYLLLVWAHSIATAVAAEALGRLCGSPGLYTLGLTHDLGRLGLFLGIGQPYAEGLSQEFTDIEEANELEKQLFGMTHCDAGAVVSREWGFPESLRISMAEHHCPEELRPGDPQSLIRASCLMADSLGFPEVPRHNPPPWPQLPERLSGLPEIEPETLWDEITRRIADLGS